MSATTVAFYAGLVLGVPGGMMILSILVAGARADEASERMARHMREAERISRLNPPDDVTDRDWMYSERNHGGHWEW